MIKNIDMMKRLTSTILVILAKNAKSLFCLMDTKWIQFVVWGMSRLL